MKPTHTQVCTLVHAVADLCEPDRAAQIIDRDRELIAARAPEAVRVKAVSHALYDVADRASVVDQIAELMKSRRIAVP